MAKRNWKLETFTEEQINEIVSRYPNESIFTISLDYECSYTLIRKILKNNDVTFEKKGKRKNVSNRV